MAQIAEQYGKVLYELRISHEDVESVRKTLETVPELIKYWTILFYRRNRNTQ